MVRYLLAASAAGGADARRLARDLRLPGWMLQRDDTMISPDYALRLWELAEHALEVPQLAITFAERYQPGELDLYDYLFSTAPTLREGLEASSRYLHLLTTNARLQIEAETDREVTYSYRYLVADGRGADLALQLAVAIFCARARARAGTGQPIAPVRLAFEQRAPRSHRAFTEAFGTVSVDFEAPATTFTLRTRDLDRPMLAADPTLAQILARYAATIPAPPDLTWRQFFRLQLTEALDDESPSLNAMARRMAVSPRTLQRHLAEQGTTWRSELDAARRWRAGRLGDDDPASLAHLLGYSHARSARRALRRWTCDE